MARAPGMTDLHTDRAASKRVGALRGLAPNPVPPREALAVMALMDCAMRSAAEGRTLRFGVD